MEKGSVAWFHRHHRRHKNHHQNLCKAGTIAAATPYSTITARHIHPRPQATYHPVLFFYRRSRILPPCRSRRLLGCKGRLCHPTMEGPHQDRHGTCSIITPGAWTFDTRPTPHSSSTEEVGSPLYAKLAASPGTPRAGSEILRSKAPHDLSRPTITRPTTMRTHVDRHLQ